MFLIIISVLFGFIGFVIGGALGQDTLAFLFGFIGFISPALYFLQKIYEEITGKDDSKGSRAASQEKKDNDNE